MTLTAGTLSQTSVGATTAVLASTAATGGTSPYTYQWYRSTTTGFSPGAGSLISGATALTLSDSGLIPNTVYYYKVVSTDVGHSNDTVTSSQLAVTTTGAVLSQNQFQQAPYVGTVDLRFAYNTVSVQIDMTETDTLYPGDPVKVYDSAGGIPKVVKCTANSDDCDGFLNYDMKQTAFVAGSRAEMSMSGNVIFLYATAAIARFAKVRLDILNNGVAPLAGSGGADIVGFAYDKAAALGDLIRVALRTPYFGKDA